MADITKINLKGTVLDIKDAGAARSSDLATKQDAINDLATIRSGAAAGTTAVQDNSYVHTDNNYTTSEKTKLAGLPTGTEVYTKSEADTKFATKTDLNNVSVATVPSNQVAVITNLDGADEEEHPNAVLHADEGRKLKEALLNYLVPILRKAAYAVTGVDVDIYNFINSLDSQPVAKIENIIEVSHITLTPGYIDDNGEVQQLANNYFYDEMKEAIAIALLDASANAANVSPSRIAEYDATSVFLGRSYALNKAQIAAVHNPAKIKAGFAASTMPAYIAYFISASPILTIADTNLDNSGAEQPYSDANLTRYASDYIDISDNKGFLLWTLQDAYNSSVCCFYDSSHTFISRHVDVAAPGNWGIDKYIKVVIPSNAVYARFAGDPYAAKTFLYAL